MNKVKRHKRTSAGFTLLEMIIAMGLMGLIFLGLGYLIKGNVQSTTKINRVSDSQAQMKLVNSQIKKDLTNAGGGIPGDQPWGLYSESALHIKYLDILRGTCEIGTTNPPQVLEIVYSVSPTIDPDDNTDFGLKLKRKKLCGDNEIADAEILQVPEGIRVTYSYFKFDPDGDIPVDQGSTERASYVIVDISIKSKQVGSTEPVIRNISTKIQLVNV